MLKKGALNGILNRRQEVKGLLRVQHIEKLCNLYVFRLHRLSPLHSSPNIIMILISRRIRWAKITECTKFTWTALRRKTLEGPRHRKKDNSKVNASRDRPRWPKEYRVG